jgi:hypothetical protein
MRAKCDEQGDLDIPVQKLLPTVDSVFDDGCSGALVETFLR